MKRRPWLIFVFLFSTGLIQAQDEFFDLPEDTAGELAPQTLDFSGELAAELRAYLYDFPESSLEFVSSANLELRAESEHSEAIIRLKAELSDQGAEPVTWEDLVEDAVVRYFFAAGFLEAGYTTVEWGKGDGMHAADPVNPLDQSEGFGGDTADLKIPVPLVRTAFYTGANSLLEFVYAPLFVPMVTADQGRWVPYEIPDTITVITDERPEMSLAHFQGGIRYTFTAGPADLGFQYYCGYMHDPGFVYLSATEMELVYTRYQLFAGEAAVAAGPFTFRCEAGFKLTEDIEGDDPSLYNSRAVYLAGFDVSVPGTKFYILCQASGDYTSGTDGLPADDIDVMTGYGYPARMHNIAVSVEHPFFHDKMNIRISGLYMPEANGYYISPEMTYDLADNLQLGITGGFYGGEEKDYSLPAFWEDNDYLQVGLKASF